MDLTKDFSLSFQLERPSEEDTLDGQGHSNAAVAIKEVIERNPDVHIIGIEGELGAGKSTIIKILESLLDKDKYHFIYFDVDKYNHTATKPALIKVIANELNEIVTEIDKGKIDHAKDLALGQILEYEKITKSRISFFVLLFVFSFALTFKYLKVAIVSVLITIASFWNGYSFDLNSTITSILAFSPAYIYVLMRWWHKKNRETMPSIGDLLKKNSTDTITEKIGINKEVGSLELKETIDVFVKAIPKDKILIIIIDNIDRVEQSKIKEIWSDIEIFTSSCAEKMRILLPFSENHVAKALNENDPESGREYIFKRLPVIFRAPPIVSFGWRKQFKKYWEETLKEISGSDDCADLIEIWCKPKGQITPRLLKRLVNDMACTIFCIRDHKINLICSLAYTLAVKHNHFSLENFLSSANSNDEHRNISLSQEILERALSRKEWTTQVACIHYQTTPEVAESELLVGPLNTAINGMDSERVYELSRIYGFDLFFSKLILSDNVFKLYRILSEIADDLESSKNDFINKWIPGINRVASFLPAIKNHDQNYINSLINLNRGYDIDLNHVERTIKSIESEINSSKGLSESGKFLYQYCMIENKTPDLIKKLSPEIYINFILRNRDIFTEWKVDSIFLNYDNALKAAAFAIESYESENVFLQMALEKISTMLSVGARDEKDTLDEVQAFPAIEDQEYKYIFSSSFKSEGNYEEIVHIIRNSVSQKTKDKWTAIIYCKAMNNGQLNSIVRIDGRQVNLSEIIPVFLSENKNYESFFNKISFHIEKFSSIIESLKSQNYIEFASKVIRFLVERKKIFRLNINSIIKSEYSLIKESAAIEPSELIGYLVDWKRHISENYLSWSKEFLVDVSLLEKNEIQDILINQFDNNKTTVDDWVNRITNYQESTEIVSSYYVNNSRKIQNSSSLGDAITSIILGDDELSEIDVELVRVLISILPMTTQGKLERQISLMLAEQATSMEQRFKIISLCPDISKLPEATSQAVREIYISLIENASDEKVINWINLQTFNFDQWDDEEIETVRGAIENHEQQKLFNNLLENLNLVSNTSSKSALQGAE